MKSATMIGLRAEVTKAVITNTPCPECEAKVGDPCVCMNTRSKRFGKPVNSPHGQRIEDWHALGLPRARRVTP